MAVLKWSGFQIIEFFNLFQNYPCLWDVSSKEYLNRNVKEAAYDELLEHLKDAGMPGTLESVKKKIKSLRDTYRKELIKVQKSRKSGVSEVYKPKLVWFSAAKLFWQSAANDRKSNTEVPQRSDDERESISDSENMCDSEPEESPKTSRLLQSTTTKPSTTKRPFTSTEPSKHAKVFKRLQPAGRHEPTTFESAIDKFYPIAELAHDDKEDQYEKFGKHVASQMRELPLRSFIILQSKIQNLLTEERLASLDKSEFALQHSDAKKSNV